MTTPTVSQFGFSTRAGVLTNIVDSNVATGWSPLPTSFSTYTGAFLSAAGLPNVGQSFPALQFDYGAPVRLPFFLLQTETYQTLGTAMLVGSDNPATSTADTVQTDDVLMGIYSQAEITAGRVLKTAAFESDIRKRYYRLCQHLWSAKLKDTPGGDTPIGGGVSGPFYQIYDAGSGTFPTPNYTSTFTMEVWGGGSCGGESSDGTAGSDSLIQNDSHAILHALGGAKATGAPNSGIGGGLGGAASGGNTLNLSGGVGQVASPASTGEGTSGAGGDAPYGGFGGAAVPNHFLAFVQGLPGNGPGGGGSGRNLFVSSGGGSYFKYPGGGSGGYSRHVFTKGVGVFPATAIPFAWSVGAGGVSTLGNGNGAPGRVRFTWD